MPTTTKYRSTNPIYRPSYEFSLLILFLLLLASCAQQGTLTGGPKDETPPELLECTPPNYTTEFRSEKIIMTFDEYFALKDIAKQLVVSPPMGKKPDFKIKGKSLEIVFKDSLQPNRTYAINFGDALVDLNESNPIKNFQYVFSTGTEIDSLQASGKVIDALDGKPAENILVMLYSGSADTLPIKTIPLYISRTDKEGKFKLRNLAAGSYKIFALKDGNTNYLYDQKTESIAFMDSLIAPSVRTIARNDSLPIVDSLPVTDSLPPADSLRLAGDSVKMNIKQPDHVFLPDNLELRLFTEVPPNQYLAGTDRLRGDQVRLTFNEKIDSLRLEFQNLPIDSMAVALEWTGDADTLDFWILNPEIALRDSITAIVGFPVLDSLEKPIIKSDTVKLRFRAVAKPPAGKKKEFGVSVSVERTKTLENGQPLVLTTSLPYIRLDSTRIELLAGKDSTPHPVAYTLAPDTLEGLILNGLPINQTHPRILFLQAKLAADSSYRLRILPGAFESASGLRNDTLDIRFKMKNKDQYGSVKMELPGLEGPGILELLDSRNKVAASKQVEGPGVTVFELLAPGKYTARMTFDTNRNGRWDTGRYLKHQQPERVIIFNKELNLKANWEVSETWKWDDL